eukprot:m.311305 g.311305  ORF g.311305 m.311305 type:complete len:347 (+) comp64758_c0_seq1:40-1080(+)
MPKEVVSDLRHRLRTFLSRPDIDRVQVRAYLKQTSRRKRKRALAAVFLVLAAMIGAILFTAYHKPTRLVFKRNAAAASFHVLRFIRRSIVMAGWLDPTKWSDFHDSECMIDNPYYKSSDSSQCSLFQKVGDVFEVDNEHRHKHIDKFTNDSLNPVVIKGFLSHPGVENWRTLLGNHRDSLKWDVCGGKENAKEFSESLEHVLNENCQGKDDNDTFGMSWDFCSQDKLQELTGVSNLFSASHMSILDEGEILLKCPFSKEEQLYNLSESKHTLMVLLLMSGQGRIHFFPAMECSQIKPLVVSIEEGDFVLYSTSYWFMQFMPQGEVLNVAYMYQVEGDDTKNPQTKT